MRSVGLLAVVSYLPHIFSHTLFNAEDSNGIYKRPTADRIGTVFSNILPSAKSRFPQVQPAKRIGKMNLFVVLVVVSMFSNLIQAAPNVVSYKVNSKNSVFESVQCAFILGYFQR